MAEIIDRTKEAVKGLKSMLGIGDGKASPPEESKPAQERDIKKPTRKASYNVRGLGILGLKDRREAEVKRALGPEWEEKE